MARWVRAAVVRVYDRRDEITLLDARGAATRLGGDSAALMRVLLAITREPLTQEEIVARVGALTDQDASASPAVRDAIEVLKRVGALVPAGQQAPAPVVTRRRLVIGLTGGIVAAHAPALAELLLQRGYELRFAATESALRFVSELALSALTHQPVARSLWPERADQPVVHLSLAEWAEAVLVHPATATTIGRIAAGDCSSVVSALAISARCPVIVVPAMNETMLLSPSVQRNLETLRDDGFIVVHSALGYEVAAPPGERAPRYGAAPPLGAVIDVVDAVLRHDAGPRSHQAPSP